MKGLRWALILLAQAVSTFIWSYFAAQTMWLSARFFNVSYYAILPVLGGVSAYFAVRKGLNNYLAWLLPCLSGMAAHYAAFYYLPLSAGPAFVCAAVSVIGAATGAAANKFGRGSGGSNGK